MLRLCERQHKRSTSEGNHRLPDTFENVPLNCFDIIQKTTLLSVRPIRVHEQLLQKPIGTLGTTHTHPQCTDCNEHNALSHCMQSPVCLTCTVLQVFTVPAQEEGRKKVPNSISACFRSPCGNQPALSAPQDHTQETPSVERSVWASRNDTLTHRCRDILRGR